LTIFLTQFIIQQLNIEQIKMQQLEADLTILEHIETEPDTTQATLAERLGVAVGTVNWHMKRLIQKGYVKVKKAERHKLRYIITPEGIALRAHLMLDYVQSSFTLYRLVRERSLKAITTLREMGINQVQVEGDGEVADICRLTCLEQGLHVVSDHHSPKMNIVGLKIFLGEDSHK
jgi:DNA-binding MarR family transcriptional regulator